MIDISIVIPIYQEGFYLKKTLQNLANQIMIPRCEIVISEFNPNRTHDSRQIIREFQENYAQIPVRLIDVYETGIAFARHQGIMHAEGDVILNFDADARFSHSSAIQMMTEPLFSKKFVLTTCENQIDLTEFKRESLQHVENSQTLMNIFNTIQQFGWPVFEPGSSIVKDVYMEIGGFSDVKQGELMNMAARLLFKYPTGYKLVRGVQCIMSPRRLVKFDEVLKKGDLEGLKKISDYEYAIRKGSTVKVE